jgi:membrane associated rhomboid family serine protease
MFILALMFDRNIFTNIIVDLGCRPSYILSLSPKIYTIVTHMYIHGGILHLLMNMIFLIFVGMPFEERVGPKKFVFIYFGAGILGVLLNAMITYSYPLLNPDVIGIGASGAIFGIMAAYAFLYPRDEIIAPLGPIITKLPVILVAVVYFLIETVYVLFFVQDSVGHVVHVGGFVSGIYMAFLLKKYEPKKKEKKADISVFEKLASTEELKNILETIKKEDIPEIRNVWIEEFMKKIRCPKCGKKLRIWENTVSCKCGYGVKL